MPKFVNFVDSVTHRHAQKTVKDIVRVYSDKKSKLKQETYKMLNINTCTTRRPA